MELKKIASFQIDHTRLEPGLYVSRIDGDVTTWDIRTRKPNAGAYIGNGAIHTIEHLAATWLRSSGESDGILYFGPMGCRTGFYLLTRGIAHSEVIRLVREAFLFVARFEGAIPGATAVECGNWMDHDLPGAKNEAEAYAAVIEGYTVPMLSYDLERR